MRKKKRTERDSQMKIQWKENQTLNSFRIVPVLFILTCYDDQFTF